MRRAEPRVGARHRATSVALVLAGALGTGGCGCDTVGYPALDVLVEDRATGRPVPLGGAQISYEGGRQAPYTETRPAGDSGARVIICCTPGEWRLRIATPGYAPYDTTVRVRSSGRCERPVLKRFVVRLQPLPPTARPMPGLTRS